MFQLFLHLISELDIDATDVYLYKQPLISCNLEAVYKGKRQWHQCPIPRSNEETTGTSIILFLTPKCPCGIQVSMYAYKGVGFGLSLLHVELTVSKIKSFWEHNQRRSISSLIIRDNKLN